MKVGDIYNDDDLGNGTVIKVDESGFQVEFLECKVWIPHTKNERLWVIIVWIGILTFIGAMFYSLIKVII